MPIDFYLTTEAPEVTGDCRASASGEEAAERNRPSEPERKGDEMNPTQQPRAAGMSIGVGSGIGAGLGLVATLLLGADLPLGLVFGAGIGVLVGLLVESTAGSRG